MDKKERDGVRFEGPKFCGRPSAAATVQRYGHSPYKMRQNSCEGWKAGGGGGRDAESPDYVETVVHRGFAIAMPLHVDNARTINITNAIT